jgi:hypothetical protein
MARNFHCGFKIAVYARTVYVRRVVEREGVSKCLTVRYLMSPGGCRKAAVHAATFSHFRHIGPSSGWVGHRRGVETAPGLGCLRRLPPEGGVPGSHEETAPCPACPPREVRRLGRLGLSRPLRRCTGLRLKPLDQSWRGRTSILVTRVGCGEMLNGCMGRPKA